MQLTEPLRHHPRVLISERSVTVVPVNGGRATTAGAPAQVEILEGTGVTDQAMQLRCCQSACPVSRGRS